MWTRWKSLTWREVFVALLEGTVVGVGMTALSIWVVHDHTKGIFVGAVAGVGTVVMLLVI